MYETNRKLRHPYVNKTVLTSSQNCGVHNRNVSRNVSRASSIRVNIDSTRCRLLLISSTNIFSLCCFHFVMTESSSFLLSFSIIGVTGLPSKSRSNNSS